MAGENTAWQLEDFVDSLVVELDKTRETLAVKAINKPLSYTVKELALDLNKLSFASGWRFGIGVGPMFADRRFNAYYYTVQPQFATPQRPAYEAKAGYDGMQVLLSTSRRFPNWWVGAFVRYQSLEGAVFRDSPLVKQRYALAGGIGFSYVFARSGKVVPSDE